MPVCQELDKNESTKLPKEDSLRKRYLFKLVANIFGLGINLVTQAIIPRALGPKAYGDFNFISSFFTQIIGFLDMGTSIGFYTKLAQRPKESTLVSFYLYFSGVVSIGIALFVAVAEATSMQTRLWPGQAMFHIYLGVVWGILNWIVVVLNKMADAYGVTVAAEVVRTFQKVLGLVLVIVLYSINKLNLENFFYYQYFLFLVLCAAFVWVMERSGYSLQNGWRITIKQVKGYFSEFYQYSHPLFSYALVGLIVGILDRWLLQMYAGSVQQGFYALSFQIGAVCFVFTNAMTPLLTREFSVAFANHDSAELARLFRRYVPLLYSIAAFFACFACVNAAKITYIIGGSQYADATTPVMIMALYPIYQTYGQLSGSVFYATGQTKLYSNIGIFFMVMSLPIVYFVLAPAELMGLNAGATGLAIKLVFFAFLSVNVQLYYNARSMKLRFFNYFAHQLICLGCLISIALLSKLVIDNLTALSSNIIASFIVCGILYTVSVLILVWFFPVIFSLRKNDINYLVKTYLTKHIVKH